MLDLLGAQVDSVVADELPKAIEFDVAIRVIGTVQDFAAPHNVEVVLSDPGMIELGRLRLPVGVRVPAPTRLPGYELNAALGGRISFTAESEGGYDLSFALDGEAQHQHKATVSVVLRQ